VAHHAGERLQSVGLSFQLRALCRRALLSVEQQLPAAPCHVDPPDDRDGHGGRAGGQRQRTDCDPDDRRASDDHPHCVADCTQVDGRDPGEQRTRDRFDHVSREAPDENDPGAGGDREETHAERPRRRRDDWEDGRVAAHEREPGREHRDRRCRPSSQPRHRLPFVPTA